MAIVGTCTYNLSRKVKLETMPLVINMLLYFRNCKNAFCCIFNILTKFDSEYRESTCVKCLTAMLLHT